MNIKVLISVLAIALASSVILFGGYSFEFHSFETKSSDEEVIPSDALKAAIMPFKEPNSKDHTVLSVPLNKEKSKRQFEAQLEAELVKCGITTDVLGDTQNEPPELRLDGFDTSNLASEQLVHALFAESDNKSRLERVHQFHLKHPSEPLALIAILNECIHDLQNSICGADLIDNAAREIKNDGAFWLAATLYFAVRKDDKRAYEAITQLDQSAHFSNNYARRIKLALQVLESRYAQQFGFNLISAIGMASATHASFSPLMKWCENDSGEATKSSACLSLGRNLVTRPTTALYQMIGFGLQQGVYEREHNEKALAAIQQQRDEARFVGPSRSMDPYVAIFMFTDEKLGRAWLNNIEVLGESQAFKLVEQEVRQQVESEQFKPCRDLIESYRSRETNS